MLGDGTDGCQPFGLSQWPLWSNVQGVKAIRIYGSCQGCSLLPLARDYASRYQIIKYSFETKWRLIHDKWSKTSWFWICMSEQ